MSDPVQENLLGLLLGALEDDERRELEEQLEVDADLRAEFAKLRDAVHPLDQSRVSYEPAFGLADRTFAFVQREVALREVQPAPEISAPETSAETSLAESSRQTTASKLPRLSPEKEPVGHARRWSVSDLVVGLSVIVAAMTLIFPALTANWERTRRLACENNLRQIGFAMHDYAGQSPQQRLPVIPQEGNRSFAGVYAPILANAGYIRNPRVFLCASSDLSSKGIAWRLPTLDEIDTASNASLIRLQRLAGGSFGYNLGFFNGDRYETASVNNQDPTCVWAADAPAWNLLGRISENHQGRGQNMLFADQHTAFVVGNLVEPSGDDVFRNDRGLVAAGVDKFDSVIGDSQARPFIRSAVLRTNK